MSIFIYAKKKYGLWTGVFLLALVSHGTMLLGKSIGIDTEDIITLKDMFYGEWLSMGRQGLVLLKLLLGTRNFNPYFAGAVTLIFITITCFLWTFLFSYISGKDNSIAISAFSGFVVLSPLITEQFYFKLQSVEITCGFSLTAVSLLLIYAAVSLEKGKKRYVLLSGAALINIVLFSLYQVMVPLFIFGFAACFFLHCFFRDDSDIGTLKLFFFFASAVFISSFVVNQIISAVWFSSGNNYLTAQIRWLTQSFKDCLINIYWHVKAVALGKGLYYSKLYPAGCLLLIGIVFCSRKGVGCIFSLLMAVSAPFYMTIICAVEPVLRSQLVMPFALAFVAYVLILLVEKRRLAAYIVIGLCVIAGYMQFRGTMWLNYTDSVRYESDVRIATSIMEELNNLEDEIHSYPIVFIGKHEAELNNSCVKGDTIGYSFFEWDADAVPRGFFNTRRILGFMHTLGGNYIQGNEEQAIEALEYSRNMNNWPMQGSIKMHNGCIIVKLSD